MHAPSFGRGLRVLSILSVLTLVTSFALVFFYAPNDADQGFVQKIFYVHVPLAIVALVGFLVGGFYGALYLWKGDRGHDLKSYVAIHQSVIMGVGVLATGSLWARASWGHWWVWGEPTLVSFLIVFLLFAMYWPLRFSIDDPERQARFAAVFAVIGAAFTFVNFLAVRLAQSAAPHPEVLMTAEGGMPAPMMNTFLLALVGMALLYITLWKYELTSKHATMRVRSLKRRLAGDEALAPLGRSAAPQHL